MVFRTLVVLVSVLALWGCAGSPPRAPGPTAAVWHDDAFTRRSDLVMETPESLFHLDPGVLATLSASDRRGLGAERRLYSLLQEIYGPQGIRLAYVTGHTTSASETWKNKRGDCLALTIMVYAAASKLGIAAHMQQVRVPIVINRRQGVDYVSGHVNVYVPDFSSVTVNGRNFGANGLIIDFEPQPGSRRMGDWLSEEQVLARYHNNRGAQHLAEGDEDAAYTYFRAAASADPTFAAAFANLAQLYVRRGLTQSAEATLQHAIALDTNAYTHLSAMHQLLLRQGRTQEAAQYADLLRRRQEEDPYYWLGLGLDAMRRSAFTDAIRALENASSLTTGFQEIHYHLALAYLRDGQRDKAAKQIALLDTLTHDDPGVAVLNKKLQSMRAKSTFF